MVSGILTEVTEYCFKKIARKTQGSAKTKLKIPLNIPEFS